MQKSDSALHKETTNFVQFYCSSTPLMFSLCDCEFIPCQSAFGVKTPKSDSNPIPVPTLVAATFMYMHIPAYMHAYAATLKKTDHKLFACASGLVELKSQSWVCNNYAPIKIN